MKYVFLLQWAPGATARAGTLRAAGFRVEIESEDLRRAYSFVVAAPPDVLVLDLAVRTGRTLDIAAALRRVDPLRDVPMVLVASDEEARGHARRRVPGAVVVAPDELVDALCVALAQAA